MIATGAAVALFRAGNLARDRLIRLNLDINLGSLFELDLAAIVIDQPVRDTNLAVQVIGTFHCDLGLFWLAAVRVGIDYLFYFPWENRSYLGFFGHDWEASTLSNAHYLGNWWYAATLGESISTIPCIRHRYNPVDQTCDPPEKLICSAISASGAAIPQATVSLLGVGARLVAQTTKRRRPRSFPFL